MKPEVLSVFMIKAAADFKVKQPLRILKNLGYDIEKSRDANGRFRLLENIAKKNITHSFL
jgi:hypothetical protein